ncbi:T9SS type A sorting domain-containing protein [Hymenobacter cellulosivorans]|uniref:T9SS type A sorting domain-containing protein n=1 Tax=Hymenobacter cellulosivorans TaxID=2932249 RepID=A0ABY4F676_9BACT|nr:T9SS type A sorting domain-containing protein [Hymenobacter cellulosivorans]UOQ52033.1 T9SS type A sorting domain-containing protein [Hymenobacter cellulosivorans]
MSSSPRPRLAQATFRAAFCLLLLFVGSTSAQAQIPTAWQTTHSFPYGPKMGLAATGDSTLITAVEAGVLRTANRGRTWTLALRAHYVTSIFATPSGLLLAGGVGKLYRSRNGGLNWDSTRLATVYPVVAMTAAPQGGLLVGTGALDAAGNEVGSGVFFSADNGQTWSARNTGLGAGRFVNHVAADSQGRLYATVTDEVVKNQPGLYMSFDDGLHWQYLPIRLAGPGWPDPVSAFDVTALAVSPQDSLLCSFTGAYQGIGVMGNFAKSLSQITDPTIGWTVRGGTSGQNWWFREPLNTFFFARNGTWFNSRQGLPNTGGTLMSRNHGRSWTLLRNGLGVGVGGLREVQQFAEFADGKVYMVQNTDPLVYWLDAGTALASAPPQLTASLQLFPNPATSVVHLANHTGQAIRSLTLTDLSGRLVRRFEVAAADNAPALPLHDQAPGLYLLNVTLGDARVVRLHLIRQ